MVRSSAQMEQVIEGIRGKSLPGNFHISKAQVRASPWLKNARMNIPCVSVLDPVIDPSVIISSEKPSTGRAASTR